MQWNHLENSALQIGDTGEVVLFLDIAKYVKYIYYAYNMCTIYYKTRFMYVFSHPIHKLKENL